MQTIHHIIIHRQLKQMIIFSYLFNSTNQQGSFFSKPAPMDPIEQKKKDLDYIETSVTLADISGGVAMLLLRKQQRTKGKRKIKTVNKKTENFTC